MFLLVLLGISKISAIGLNLIPETGTPPPSRLYLVMDYTPAINGLLVFGGSLNSKKYYNDIWVFLLDILSWTEIRPTTSIVPCNLYLAARINSGCYYDKVSDQFFIFGGITMNGPQNDIWRFSFISYSWYKIATTNTIRGRHRFGCTGYTDTDGTAKIVIFGGSLSSDYSNDLYIYDIDSSTWNLQPSDGDTPPLLNGPKINYYSGYFYVFGGEVSGGTDSDEIYFNSTYRYNLNTLSWEYVSVDSTYSHRYFTGSSIIEDYLYLFYGWSNEDNEGVDSTYRLNLVSPVGWEEVVISDSDENILVRDSYGIASDGSLVYMFGGYNANTEATLNSLLSIDVASKTWELMTKDFSAPAARMMHSLEVIDGKFYLFGGVDGAMIYDDFWVFDPQAIKWESLNSIGESPTARYAHSSSAKGNTMIVWGGMGTSNLLNDMYEFNSITSIWGIVEHSGTIVPNARMGGCLVVDLPLIFIHGGGTLREFYNDVWIFDTSSNSYSMYLDESGEFPGRSFHQCELFESENEDLLLYSIYGIGEGEEAQGSIWYLNFTDKRWNMVVDSGDYNRGKGLVKITGNSFISISGENWSLDPYFDVFVIEDMDNPVMTKIGEVSECIYGSDYVYFNKSIYSYGGGDSLGHILRNSISTANFYRIDIEELCNESGLCEALCSPGTYYDGTICNMCSKGQYSETYNQESCDKCQSGTFNANEGANSNRECYPCEQGTYSDKTGSAYCLDCASGTDCPAGSKAPISKPIVSEKISVQPDIYDEISQDAIDANNITLYVVVTISIIYLILVIVFFQKVSETLKGLDLYKHMHTYEQEIPVTLRKTSIGGTFGVVFILVAILIITSTVIAYTMNNILESKSLVPLVIIEDEVTDFRSDIYSKIIFVNYGGSCISAGGTCRDEIFLNTYKIYGDSHEHFCSIENENDCVLEYYCNNCVIDTSAYIEISLNEILSYCSGITVNLTTDSSIPDYISSILETIVPPESTILRGSTPSYFYFTAIPSLFKAGVDDNDPDTGYHISAEINPELGSYYIIDELSFTSDLKVNIYLEKSDSSLYTLRYQRTTLIALFSGLLGSVFGVMGAVGAVMRFYEGNKIKIDKKIEDNNKIGKMIQSRISYKTQCNGTNDETEVDQNGSDEKIF